MRSSTGCRRMQDACSLGQRGAQGAKGTDESPNDERSTMLTQPMLSFREMLARKLEAAHEPYSPEEFELLMAEATRQFNDGAAVIEIQHGRSIIRAW